MQQVWENKENVLELRLFQQFYWLLTTSNVYTFENILCLDKSNFCINNNFHLSISE